MSLSFLALKYLSHVRQNQTYELYAAVNHLGGLRNGHYTATIKDSEEWYCFDDSRVTPVRANCTLGLQIINLMSWTLQTFLLSYH